MRRDLGTLVLIDGNQYYLPYSDCSKVTVTPIPSGLGDCTSIQGCGVQGSIGGYNITINVTYNEFLDGDYNPGARITEDRLLSLPASLFPLSNLRWVTVTKSTVYGLDFPFNLGGWIWDESNYTATDLFANLVYDINGYAYQLVFEYALPQSSIPTINGINILPYGGAAAGGGGSVGLYYDGNLFMNVSIDPNLAESAVIVCPTDCLPDEHKVILDRNTGLFCCCKCG